MNNIFIFSWKFNFRDMKQVNLAGTTVSYTGADLHYIHFETGFCTGFVLEVRIHS